jgi:2-oxoisovalerate dehydrogenase E1 component beta subunit
VPDGHYTVPLGKAAVVREGSEADRPRLRHDGPRRARRGRGEGIDAEVIDLRTIVPLDIETIEASVKKTGRCVVVHEATRTSGFGAELARWCRSAASTISKRRSQRVTGWDTPYPHSMNGPISRARPARPRAQEKLGGLTD